MLCKLSESIWEVLPAQIGEGLGFGVQGVGLWSMRGLESRGLRNSTQGSGGVTDWGFGFPFGLSE